jgi:hypothetical protein
MFDKAKYVIVDGNVVVFTPALEHRSMVPYGKKCTSAGFVTFYKDVDSWGDEVIKAKAFGKSISLGIESKPDEDSERITLQICGRY